MLAACGAQGFRTTDDSGDRSHARIEVCKTSAKRARHDAWCLGIDNNMQLAPRSSSLVCTNVLVVWDGSLYRFASKNPSTLSPRALDPRRPPGVDERRGSYHCVSAFSWMSSVWGSCAFNLTCRRCAEVVLLGSALTSGASAWERTQDRLEIHYDL